MAPCSVCRRDLVLGEPTNVRADLIEMKKNKEEVLGQREGRSEANWFLR